MKISIIKIIALAFILLIPQCKLSAQISKKEHIVKAGETLYSIAIMYNVDINTLKNANNGITENISSGQKIIIPQISDKKIYHTIVAKETLYSISRKYDVSIEHIKSANPGLDETNFKVGSKIVIPNIDTEYRKANPASKNFISLTGKDCREIYVVKKNDTFFTIAKKYNLTVKELLSANPDVPSDTYQISKGDNLCIPYKNETSQSVNTKGTNSFTTNNGKTIHISLLMPFYNKGYKAKEAILYYRGFIAAIDSIRKDGTSFEITAKDLGESLSETENILKDSRLSQSDMIIAYGDELKIPVIANFCNEKNIKLFLPFNNEVKDVFTNQHIYLGGQPNSYEQSATVQHFMGKYSSMNIVFIECNNQREEDNYTNMLIPSLKVNAISYKPIYLNSTDEDFIKAFSKDKRNIILCSSKTEEAYKLIDKRLESLSNSMASIDYSIFGYKEWISFNKCTKNSFFKHDVRIMTPKVINVYTSSYQQLLNMYRKHFGQSPETENLRLFFTGFDSGMFFIKNIDNLGQENGNKYIKTKPIEIPFSLTRVNNTGGMVNKAYRIIRYTKIKTIEITDYAQ